MEAGHAIERHPHIYRSRRLRGDNPASTVELILTERGHFAATLTRIDLHRLWMQRSTENLPRIAHTHSPGKRAADYLVPDPARTRSDLERDDAATDQHNRSGPH